LQGESTFAFCLPLSGVLVAPSSIFLLWFYKNITNRKLAYEQF